MFRQGVKNYWKSLKYFFTPLGTMFLGMMIGFSILLPGVLAAVSSLVDGVKKLSESVNLDFDVLFHNLWDAVRALNWSKPVEAIKTLFSAEWVHGVLTEALQTVLGTDFETFKAEIVSLVGVFTSEIKANIVVFFACWILGFIAGYALVKFQIRRDIARRSLWKFLLTWLLNGVLSTAYLLLCGWMFLLWKSSLYLTVVLALLLSGAYALFEAYLLYGYKKFPLKAAVNMKNIALYMAVNLVIFLISVCLTLVAVAINALMGLFVGLALFEIALIVISMNAESYVQSIARAADGVAAENTDTTENVALSGAGNGGGDDGNR